MGIRALGKVLRTRVSDKLTYAYYNMHNYICCLEKGGFLWGKDYDERKEWRKLCSKFRSPSLPKETFHRLHYREKCGYQIRIATQYPGAKHATFLYVSNIKLNLASSSYPPRLGKSLISGLQGLPVPVPQAFMGPGKWDYPDGYHGGCHGYHCFFL